MYADFSITCATASKYTAFCYTFTIAVVFVYASTVTCAAAIKYAVFGYAFAITAFFMYAELFVACAFTI